ncbi:hypothetical protein A3850_012015 [Lewinella sp. 4G2]|nr:hypothetical protein A3850_012015 [Lewinella sp. 4G2]
MAAEVRAETERVWAAYERYAWPHDNLLPLSKSYRDWYAEPIFISPIDGYSTLKLMGLDEQANRIERYVADSISFDRDIDVKVFEVNIRVLGGLLAMYAETKNPAVLAKAADFGDRMLPAFDSPTGMPYYYVNLKTGKPSGAIVNVAEAGSYLLELGLLSYYTNDAKYYQTGKRATLALNTRRSVIGLFGRDINVETGEWTETNSMVGAYADSYFEYLYKAYLLFGDPELKEIWDDNISAIQNYLPDEQDSLLWYPRVTMETGEVTQTEITLWDAYFPALLVLADDVDRAKHAFNAWDVVVTKHGMTPMVYNYAADTVVNGYHQLNPEVIESAYYLHAATGDERYRTFARDYFTRLKECCRTEVAFTHLKDVRTGERDDEMATFFVAETLKYFYLLYGGSETVGLDTHVFTTEAHPFAKKDIIKAGERLGF